MTRSRISLDGRWDFFPDPERRLDERGLDAAADARQIGVPGPWQAQFDDLRDYSGVAWYRRRFRVPRLDGSLPPEFEPTYVLCFGAVDYHTSVWLNDKLLGHHEGGYLPFELRLDDAVRQDGENLLVVRVIDPSDDERLFPDYPFAEIPHGKQSWYGPIGGIWQSVWLEVRHRTHLTRLKVTPDVPNEQALVAVQLNEAPRRGTLVLELEDPQGQLTRYEHALDGNRHHDLTLPISSPLLWDTRTPHLYRLTARFCAGDTQLDTLGTHFGMRQITTSPDGHLMLNGRMLYLRGALDQDYYPKLIYTPFSDAELDDQFAKARHMGLNCLRTHIKITDPRYYDAADRAGILIWTELPNWQNLTEQAKRRARETLVGMVERDWNHPSIIIWTIINEGWGVDLAVNADHRAWLAETYAQLKQLDPTRLIVGNSPCFTNFHVVTDIEDFHNYYSIPDHYRQWREWVRTFASRPPWTFAHTYENIETWRAFLRDPWNPLPRMPAPEVQRKGNEPMVVSEFGNWGLPDVPRLKQCYGGEPWWFETGTEWGDGVVYPHGVEHRFKAFHLDKIFGDLSSLAAASQRMQFTALKYQIEQMRRHPSIVGYIITEFTDVHWECNGLLDQCRNPKAYYDVIGNVNRPDAIVPDWERVVFWEGERCEVHLMLSHFSDAALEGSHIEWHVDVWPAIRGSFTGLHPQIAQVTSIGTVAFEIPPLEHSVRGRLEMRLIDRNGEELTCNHHEIYAFPRSLMRHTPEHGPRLWAQGELAVRLGGLGYQLVDELEQAEIAVAEVMSDELRWHLQNGGRVLWLAERSESKQTYLGALGIAQRQGRSWQGDWASNFNWLRQEKLFGAIPSGGLVDFAFADLIPECVIVGLQPSDFNADVHAGLFVGWLHHVVGLVAERRVGAGRLLISTFLLRERLHDHPVARIMFDDMLAHVQQVGREQREGRVSGAGRH
jgi:hypothetical protein